MKYLLKLSYVFITLVISFSFLHAQCPDYFIIDGVPEFRNTTQLDVVFGGSVSGVGDIDKDGVPDFLVGASRSLDDFGRVFVYSGKTGDTIFTLNGQDLGLHYFGSSVGGFGDFNSDGYPDIVASEQAGHILVFSGADKTILKEFYTQSLYYGYADVNKDGHPDIIIGDPNYECIYPIDTNFSFKVGRVVVLSGLTGDTLQIINNDCQQSRQYDWFGMGVNSAGDVNNDGYDDILVSAPGTDYDSQRKDYGKAFVFSGKNGDTLMEVMGKEVGEKLEGGIGIGDIDNDNFDDVLFRLPTGVVTGYKLLVYSGRTNNLMYTLEYGTGFRGVGDLNDDGYNDFMVSDYTYGGNRGRIILYSGFNGEALSTRTGESTSKFGASFAQIGDIDNDGQNEIVVGSPFVKIPSSSWVSTGRVQVINCVIPDAECNADNDTDGDEIGDMCDNCIWSANPEQKDSTRDGIGDRCESFRTFSEGSNISNNIIVGGSSISMTFDQINTGGAVYVSAQPSGPDSYLDFVLKPSDPVKFYDITTDIAFDGGVTITLPYNDNSMTSEEENNILLLHYNGIRWVDITTERDTLNNWVKGKTTTLSPFATGVPSISTDITEITSEQLPDNFELSQNYPNPFNPITKINFSLPTKSKVKIEIFNIKGQKINTLLNSIKSAGFYSIEWDGTDNDNNKVASGIYFYKISTDTYTESKKMVLLK